MEWNRVLFLVPYLLALAITTSVFFYAWQHRHIRGGSAYVWYVAGQVFWSIGYILELLAPTLGGKIFWDGVQWIAGFFILIAFPVFAVQYTDYELKRPRLTWGLASIIPILMMVLVLTDSQHHSIYSDPHLINDSIFPELNYKFTRVVYGYAIYSYLVTFTGLGLLIRRIFRPHRLYRSQILTVTIGFFIPVVFTILTVAGVDFKPYRDVSILTFALGNIIIAWGLFRYKLFSVIPIARDLIIDNMDDVVVVLDTQDRVTDINHVALATIDKTSAQAIGQPAHVIFASWPELIRQFENPTTSRTKIAVVSLGKQAHYEVKSTMLYSKRKRYIGRVFVARNVTERIDLENKLKTLNKELEVRVANRTEELRESEERYRRLAENAPDIIFRYTLSPTPKLEYINPAVERITGYNPEECYANPLLMLNMAHPDDAHLTAELMQSLDPLDKPIIMRWIGKDSVVRWMESRIVPVYDEANQLVAVEGLTRDITERKQAEETLRESEERFRLLAETSTDMISRHDPNGVYLYVSPACRTLLGYEPEELVGHPAFEFIHPDDIAVVDQSRSTILAQSTISTTIFRIRHKNGQYIWFETTSHTIPDDETGTVTEIHATTRDVNARKLVEKALQESEERLRAIVDEAPFGAHLYQLESDEQLVFIGANHSADQILQVNHKQFIGKTIEEAFPSLVETEIPSAYRRVATSGERFQMDQVDYDDAGIRGAFEIHAFQTGEGRMAVFFRDITERKRAEEALRKSAEQYRAVVDNQTEFIVRWKPDRTRTFVNEAYCRYFGLTHEQAMTVDFMTLIVEEDRAVVQEKISRLEEGLVNSATEIHRVIKPDGSIGWNEWVDTALRDEGGNLIEFQSVGRDVTARKQAEEDLRKLSHAVEQSNASIVITDATGIIEYVNPYFSELTGYTLEEVIGQNPRILQSEITDKAVYKDLWKTITDGKEWRGEFCNKKKNGELYWETASISPITDSQGKITHFVAVKTDITERKQAEETIVKQLAFEELMTVILTSFATCPHDEIDARIQDALQKIATFVEVERAYMIIINPEHRKSWGVTHEWNAPHIPLRIIERNNLFFGTFPWAENQILKGNVIRINTLDDYPPEASAVHKLHQAEGAKSVLNVPVRGSENLISGCIGVNTFSYSSTWKDDDITHLKMVGDAIANLLERKRAEEMLLNAYDTTLEGWAKALELRDKETENHSRRVTELTVTLAQAMGIKGDDLIQIRRGSILHDIGKMGIPDEILRKRGKLTISERKVIEQHPIYSYELLSHIPFLEKALEVPYCHHEHWDGSGYPRGLKEDEIPLTARIFTVIDVWDAVQSDRPYNQAWPKEKAIQYLKDESGKYFDPECVAVFLDLVEQGKI